MLEVRLRLHRLLLYWLAGIRPPGEDPQTVIGDSRLAYVGADHPFSRAAEWHDRMYSAGYRRRAGCGMSRYEVDVEFLRKMLAYAAHSDSLAEQAVILFLLVRRYGESWWEDECSDSTHCD